MSYEAISNFIEALNIAVYCIKLIYENNSEIPTTPII